MAALGTTHRVVVALRVDLAAANAQLAHEALREHAEQARTQQERLDAHVDESRHRRRGVVRVHRGEHQVTRERGLDRNLRGLEIADLADHDHVRVLAQDRAQRFRERQVNFRVHLRLADPGELVLDRVFDGEHVRSGGVDAPERRIERRRLARTRGPGDEQDAVRLVDQLVEARQRLAAHAQPFERELGFGFVEQAQHRAFAVRRRQGGDAHVDRTPADAQRDPAVLRQALFGDVELSHDFQARDQRGVQGLVRLHDFAQRAVDAKAHRAAALVGLDVDVARAVLRRLREQRVEHADDGRVVRRLEQVFDRRQFLHHAAQVHRALDFADHDRGARLAAGVSDGDSVHERRRGLAQQRVDVVKAQHLAERAGCRTLGGVQDEAIPVVFEQHRVRLGEGVGQGVARAHGASTWSVPKQRLRGAAVGSPERR